ncbi:MAG: head-tail connector protein [Desulfovibrio sp.]|nr:head-tail connector protein [Desulfovibrio sp.]
MDRWQEVKAFASHLQGARTARESEWRDLARWICPYRGVFAGEDLAPRATRRNRKAFTQAATQALLRGASGMTTGMTPRNIAWFRPEFEDEGLVELPGARAWLDAVDWRMKQALADGGFYQSAQAFNTDLLWAGCGLLYSETSPVSGMRYECCQIGTFSVALDPDGRLDAVVRSMSWTPARLAQTFGKRRMTEGARKRLEKSPYEPVRVMHMVRRRHMRDPQKQDKANMPWESFFWEDEGGEDFLAVGGYMEMPYFYACWHEGQTVYGTGPGDEALPDAMQMDALERNKLEGLAKLKSPPVQYPYTMKDRVKLGPNEMNPVAERVKIEPIIDLSPYAQAFRWVQEELQTVGRRLEQELQASIFASMPLEQRPKDMSATEFLERKREALQQLGPVISAYEPNVLTPLLERTAAALDRASLLPPPPESLQGIPLMMQMTFVSPMANALRQTGAETTRAFLQDVAGIVQATQSLDVMDKVDVDQAVDELATGLGVPGRIIRADAEVEQIRQARARQAQAQQAMAMQAQQAETAAAQAQGLRDAAGAAETVSSMMKEEPQNG